MAESVSADVQAPDADKIPIQARKCLSMEFPNGCAVAGYALDDGGFEWVFRNDVGIRTRIRLSEDATYAIGIIADSLLDPTGKEAA